MSKMYGGLTSVIPLGDDIEVEEYEPTMAVGIGAEEFECDPVVGWLVCTAGVNRGKAYRLHSGTNFIGRSKRMDVCISNDLMISSNNAVLISYDDRTNIFFIERGEGKNQVYINGKLLRSSEDLYKNDRITIGNSEFLFFPFCGEKFKWKNI